MKKYIELIRVKHWVKNFLIFIPIICSKSLSYNNILKNLIGFFAFSFLTSFIYIINDIKDIEKDKLHERKKNRPLPSGRIKKSIAIYIAILMITLSFIISIIINNNTYDNVVVYHKYYY